MKNVQDGVTAARRELQRGLPTAAQAQLNGRRWCWVTEPENLLEEHREAFARMRQDFPEWGKRWDQRERLRAIFEDRTIGTPDGDGSSWRDGWPRCAHGD